MVKENANFHFVKEIDYSREQWRTDFIFGQKGSTSHGHGALSGSQLWYLEDENGKVIIENGNVVQSF